MSSENRGKPILEIWLENLSKAGCEEVIINTHYLSEKVEEYLEGRKFGDMKIITTYEPKLLGTAGTLLKNADFLLGKTVCSYMLITLLMSI